MCKLGMKIENGTPARALSRRTCIDPSGKMTAYVFGPEVGRGCAHTHTLSTQNYELEASLGYIQTGIIDWGRGV